MSDTSFYLLLSFAPLAVFAVFAMGIAYAVYQWGKPRGPQAKR